MLKKIILGFIFIQTLVFSNPIKLDFIQFDNHKKNINNITRQIKNSARKTNYEGKADLSYLPRGYLIAMSTPVIESLEIQKGILKHLLEKHSEELENNRELQFEFVRRAETWEENYKLWYNIKNGNY